MTVAQSVGDVMTRDPVVLPANAPLEAAARVMKERGIGDVFVADGEKLCGLVTDRDLVVRGLAEAGVSASLGQICSPELFVVSPGDKTEDAIRLMRDHAIRRLPVVQDGHLVGVVSLGDLAERHDRDSALGHISAAPANR